MKKFLLFIALIICISIASVYLFIPKNIIVNRIVYSGVKSTSILRALHDDSKWQQWFPGENENGNFAYNHQTYKPGKKEYSSLAVSIANNNTVYSSLINVIGFNFDSSALQWNLEFKASNNPFKRIEQYQAAKKIKEDMDIVLGDFATFVQQTKNIYGLNIKRTTLTDTALVSIKKVSKQYPSTQQIYSMVDELKQYIQQQHAEEHNYPMLNITWLKDSSCEVMVGIPTNIPLEGNNIIKPKRMVMLKNKTVVTDVTGDNAAIQQAFKATNNYMNDYQLSSPVIPFQQLITNRSKEKDSTKWVTKIFTPFS